MPGLSDKAVLEIDLDNRTGVFEFRGGLGESGEVTREFILSNRGQYLRQAFDLASGAIDDIQDADFERRRGYHVDGGAGEHSFSISFEAGFNDGRWGDGSTDPTNPDDVTQYDAAGCGPLDQKQILEHYLAEARTDSGGRARLYHGQFTDGTYATTAGAFGEPLVVAISEARIEWDGGDSPSSIEGTIELTRTALLPEIEEALNGVQEAIDDAVDELADYVPDV
ncbi:hypothetical protein [Halosolutus halophilus]|uniref:hypothetical protein n=1 Tax=Halosolutus halophilus TaxID=1552990 RepID=UPI002234F246|nr:hypothetical protein [Halosolutus halophilus]